MLGSLYQLSRHQALFSAKRGADTCTCYICGTGGPGTCLPQHAGGPQGSSGRRPPLTGGASRRGAVGGVQRILPHGAGEGMLNPQRGPDGAQTQASAADMHHTLVNVAAGEWGVCHGHRGRAEEPDERLQDRVSGMGRTGPVASTGLWRAAQTLHWIERYLKINLFTDRIKL